MKPSEGGELQPSSIARPVQGNTPSAEEKQKIAEEKNAKALEDHHELEDI